MYTIDTHIHKIVKLDKYGTGNSKATNAIWKSPFDQLYSLNSLYVIKKKEKKKRFCQVHTCK